MKGYVARKGERWYAVIYEGLDPVTGRERRTWHAAGPDRDDAEQLATRLAAKSNGAGASVTSPPNSSTSLQSTRPITPT